MKPDWKDAPEWANWLAMDMNGDWYWYEKEPEKSNYYWECDVGTVEYADTSAKWQDSKEKRQ